MKPTDRWPHFWDETWPNDRELASLSDETFAIYLRNLPADRTRDYFRAFVGAVATVFVAALILLVLWLAVLTVGAVYPA